MKVPDLSKLPQTISPVLKRVRIREPRHVRLTRVYLHRLLPHQHDSANVALSVFFGVFVGIMPTIGVALPLTVGLCWIFRTPKIPGIVSSFVANPFTQFGFFYPSGYAIGRWVVQPEKIHFDFLAKLKTLSFGNFTDVLGQLMREAGSHVGAFMLGITVVSLFFGFVFAVAAYFGAEYRKKKHLEKRNLNLSQTLREN